MLTSVAMVTNPPSLSLSLSLSSHEFFLNCQLALGISAFPSGRAGGQQAVAPPQCSPKTLLL